MTCGSSHTRDNIFGPACSGYVIKVINLRNREGQIERDRERKKEQKLTKGEATT
jgi:hypothetical protein